MQYLQKDGDHLVRITNNGIVSKVPCRSRLTLAQARKSTRFFLEHFPEFVPDTRVIPYKNDSYEIRQEYIYDAVTFGDFLKRDSAHIPAHIREQIQKFSDRARQVLEKTGTYFDIIGYPYGLKGQLGESSNLLVTTERLWLVDTIMSKGIISQPPWARKITTYILPGRRKRKVRFLNHLDTLHKISQS